MWAERKIILAAAILAATCQAALSEPVGRFGIGKPASPAEIAAWDIDIRADGVGLPPGRGSVHDGKALYADHCAACHGERGQGAPAGSLGARQAAPFEPLVGGAGTLGTARPVKTVGSFWPYATTLFDFVNRAMPFNAPQSLSPDQVYAVSAYVLYLNGLVAEDAVLDAASLPKVRMPNRNGFTTDPRPDVVPAR